MSQTNTTVIWNAMWSWAPVKKSGWMLRRTNTCRLTDQLMVNKELIWHGVLWQNRQNEGLWPAKWGSDLQQHNLWNLCLPTGDTSPPAAFDQCAAPTAVPACQPPLVSVHFTSFQGDNCAIMITEWKLVHKFTLAFFLCPSFVAFAPC